MIRWLRRLRHTMTAIDPNVYYPDLMLPHAPRGYDVRGDREIELYDSYMTELFRQRVARHNPPVLPDPEQAGYVPVSLEATL